MAYAEAITALADPTRRSIFEALRVQPCRWGNWPRDSPSATDHGEGGHTRCDRDLDIHFHIFHALERHHVDAGDHGGAA